MKKESLNRGNEIEKEIENLERWVAHLKLSDKAQNPLELRVAGKTDEVNPTYLEKHYGAKHASCPEYLKETLNFQLEMVKDVILKKVNNRIKELEKEFESL